MGWFTRWLRAQPPLVDADAAQAVPGSVQCTDKAPMSARRRFHVVGGEVRAAVEDGVKAVPVDHYSESLKATQHALHAALMGHSQRQQEEADAVRAVDDQAEPESAATPQVFILMQFGSGYTKTRPDENREKTIVGVYRTAVRAWRARENLRSILSARHSGSEHSYYHTIEKMDLL